MAILIKNFGLSKCYKICVAEKLRQIITYHSSALLSEFKSQCKMTSTEEEVKNFNEKLRTLTARKAKLSGSKHKRERQKVNKQISQIQKRLSNIAKENEGKKTTNKKLF